MQLAFYTFHPIPADPILEPMLASVGLVYDNHLDTVPLTDELLHLLHLEGEVSGLDTCSEEHLLNSP